MIKGTFTYNNREFKYKFKILEACCSTESCSYGLSVIYYKYKKFQLSDFIYVDTNMFNTYKYLLNKYDNMDETELKAKIKEEIIKEYKYNKLKKKWR